MYFLQMLSNHYYNENSFLPVSMQSCNLLIYIYYEAADFS